MELTSDTIPVAHPRSIRAVPDEELTLRAWRRLAEEREQALAAQENINRRLEETNRLIEAQVEALRREIEIARKTNAAIHPADEEEAQASAALSRAAELRLEVGAMRATIAWKMAERLRRVFPPNTRRGRVLRTWLRRMLGPGQR